MTTRSPFFQIECGPGSSITPAPSVAIRVSASLAGPSHHTGFGPFVGGLRHTQDLAQLRLDGILVGEVGEQIVSWIERYSVYSDQSLV